jgi:hypothetical protein
MKTDLISKFVDDSRQEKGERVELNMRKEVNGAGFCIRGKGGQKAIDALRKALDRLELEASK